MLGAEEIGGRSLNYSTTVSATPEQVWDAWTTETGLTAFMCDAAFIEPVVGGAYEIYFDMDAPAGSRGSETCTILAYAAPHHLAFSWNFPPSMPAIRFEHTRVDLQFAPTSDGRTEVRFTQTGWQDGPAWDEGYRYFERAWRSVLHWLEQYFSREVPDSKR